MLEQLQHCRNSDLIPYIYKMLSNILQCISETPRIPPPRSQDLIGYPKCAVTMLSLRSDFAQWPCAGPNDLEPLVSSDLYRFVLPFRHKQVPLVEVHKWDSWVLHHSLIISNAWYVLCISLYVTLLESYPRDLVTTLLRSFMEREKVEIGEVEL